MKSDLIDATLWALDAARSMLKESRASGTSPDVAQVMTRRSDQIKQFSPEGQSAINHVLGAVQAASQGLGYAWE